jgi:hypothetical protein
VLDQPHVCAPAPRRDRSHLFFARLSIGPIAVRVGVETPARCRRPGDILDNPHCEDFDEIDREQSPDFEWRDAGERPMKQYLLSIYQPDGPPPPRERLEPIMRDVGALLHEIKEAGVWVFNGGLHPPSTATVLRPADGEVLMTDGPFVEGKEHIGGLVVIKARDLDAALAWGRKLARATTLPIEVRPLQGHGEA